MFERQRISSPTQTLDQIERLDLVDGEKPDHAAISKDGLVAFV
jgi:hypothetical protein